MLAQCTTSNRGLLSKVKEAGGFERITQLLQWATLTFALLEEDLSLFEATEAADTVEPCAPNQGPSDKDPSRRLLETGDAFEGPFFHIASQDLDPLPSPPSPLPSMSPRAGGGANPTAAKPPTSGSRRPPLAGACWLILWMCVCVAGQGSRCVSIDTRSAPDLAWPLGFVAQTAV